jgi:Fuc2NAc and GlcNAc transferase
MLDVLWIGSLLAASYLLTRLVLLQSCRLQLIDYPNQRSSHAQPTPRGGGIAIVASSLAAVVVAVLLGIVAIIPALGVLLSGGAVAVVGLCDDRWTLPAWSRLAVHFMAALGLVATVGWLPEIPLGSGYLSFGILMPVLTVVGAVWLINLSNFMDGIDGLAGAEGVFVMVAGGTLAALHGSPDVSFLCLSAGAATAGFLAFNWPPAKIFMGDVGSGFFGLLYAAVILIDISREVSHLWVWMILLSAFLTDSTWTLLRRIASGMRVHEAHRTHAYQHAASRWGHARVTLGFSVLNVFWLLPLAIASHVHPQYGAALFVLAVCPLAIAAWKLRGGLPGLFACRGELVRNAESTGDTTLYPVQ